MGFASLSKGNRTYLKTLIEDALPRFRSLDCDGFTGFLVRRWRSELRKNEPPVFVNAHCQSDQERRFLALYGLGEDWEEGGKSERWDYFVHGPKGEAWTRLEALAEDFVRHSRKSLPPEKLPQFGGWQGNWYFMDGLDFAQWLHVLQEVSLIGWEVGCPREWEPAWRRAIEDEHMHTFLRDEPLTSDSIRRAKRSLNLPKNSEVYLQGETLEELKRSFQERWACEGWRSVVLCSPEAAEVYPREDQAFFVWRRIDDVVRSSIEVLEKWRQELYRIELDGVEAASDEKEKYAGDGDRKPTSTRIAKPDRGRKSKSEKQKREALVEGLVRQDDRFPTIKEVMKETGLTQSQVRDTAAWKIRPQPPKVNLVEFGDAFHQRAGSNDREAAKDREAMLARLTQEQANEQRREAGRGPLASLVLRKKS